MNSSLTPEEAAAIGIKLRESCDSCLQAKVKCGKGRPVCQRCLQNGANCAYSPSARAGRKNRHSTGGVKKSGSSTTAHRRPASVEVPKKTALSSSTSPWSIQNSLHSQVYPATDIASTNNAHSMAASHCPTEPSQFFGTTTPPLTSDDEALGLSTSKSMLPATEDNACDFMPTPPSMVHTDCLDEFNHFDGPLSASTIYSMPDFNLSSPSNRIDQAIQQDNWTSHNQPYDSLPPLLPGDFDSSFLDLQSSSRLSPKPNPYPHIAQQLVGHQRSLPTCQCDCLTDCLQSLKELHNKSWAMPTNSPPFDVVLQVNNAAINATSKMLTCTACSAKGGLSMSTMLMATIFGKALSLYRAAVHERFEPNRASQDIESHGSLNFGAYTLDGEDKHILEIEILLFELKKVEKSMRLWREKSQHFQADKDVTSVFEALALYLDKNLQCITDFLRQRRTELRK